MLASLPLLLALAAPAAEEKPALAQDAEAVTFCEIGACRKNVDFTLKTGKGKETRRFQQPMPPSIQPGFLTILPGERIEAVAEFRNGSFAGWRPPKAGDGPEVHRITIELTQNDNDAGMTATIQHKGPVGVKLNMGFLGIEDHARARKTSSCPLLAEFSTFESWPHPIFELLVDNVKELDANASMDCE